MPSTLFENSDRFDFVKVVQWLEDRIPLEKDPALDPVRQEDRHLVSCVLAGGHSKHVVQLFQSSLFRF